MLLSGDFGGGSFKLCLQNLGAKKPNSVDSALLVREMFADDTYDNLKIAFDGINLMELI